MTKQYSQKQLRNYVNFSIFLGLLFLFFSFALPIFILFSIAAFFFTAKFKKQLSKFNEVQDVNINRSSNIKTKRYYNVNYSSGISSLSQIYDIAEIPSEFVVIDFETTGFEKSIDRIIEVAVVTYKDGEIVDSFSQLIDPEMKIPTRITEITGIDNSMLSGKPKIYQVISEIYSRVNGKVILGYNVSFDIGFLGSALHRNNLVLDKVKCFDVLQLVKETVSSKNVANRKLQTIKNYFKITNVSHRALSDCEVTFEVFKKCCKIKENYNIKLKADQLERLSKLNELELSFIRAVEDNLQMIDLKDRLSYNVMADKVINFDIDCMQIGRVKLRGKSYNMQILDRDNALWLDVEDVNEAINNIKYWVKYCKYLTK